MFLTEWAKEALLAFKTHNNCMELFTLKNNQNSSWYSIVSPADLSSRMRTTSPSLQKILTTNKDKKAAMSKDPLSDAVEIVQGRLYYKAFPNDPRTYDVDAVKYTHVASPSQSREGGKEGSSKRKVHFFSIDSELVYWNFFLDFGPLNLGQLYRFCEKINNKLRDPRLANRVICFYSNSTYAKRANAMYLIGAWQVLYMRRSPEEACAPFTQAIFPQSSDESRQNSPRSVIPKKGSTLAAIPPFHDASPCQCTYDLSVLDCLRGLAKARTYNFFNFSNFNIKEYEYFEQVENGDLNWIIQDKILAFAGPQYERNVTREGCYTLTPQDYIPYFINKKVGLVVRLNKKMYDEEHFRKAGIEHFEQYYLDGSCPSINILKRIVEAFETVPADKGFAVHCKAGLGRTGTNIGAYIMKHYKFTAREVIGWMRICRPGMVIGPQQHFLQDIEQQMWYEGDVMRMKPSRALSTRSKKSEKGQRDKRDRSGSVPSMKSLAEREKVQYDKDSEAVIGRVGQADELLARRATGKS